jgi:hypothetical protein
MSGCDPFAQHATADVATANNGEQAGNGLRCGTHGKTLSMHGVWNERAKKAARARTLANLRQKTVLLQVHRQF